jgi:hypothetical protein
MPLAILLDLLCIKEREGYSVEYGKRILFRRFQVFFLSYLKYWRTEFNSFEDSEVKRSFSKWKYFGVN